MTKKEALRIEYFRQRKRIQGIKRRYKKQGFEVDFELPKIPKNITQGSINKLEKIKPKQIQEKSIYVDPLTGEELSYFHGKKVIKERKSEQTQAYVKTAQYEYETLKARDKLKDEYIQAKKEEYLQTFDFSDHVIDAFRNMIALFPKMAEPYLSKWLDTAIEQFRKEVVADGLAKAINDGNMLTRKTAYSETELANYTERLFKFFNVGNMEREEFETAFDESKTYIDYN
jgi:hypothetical protein